MYGVGTYEDYCFLSPFLEQAKPDTFKDAQNKVSEDMKKQEIVASAIVHKPLDAAQLMTGHSEAFNSQKNVTLVESNNKATTAVKEATAQVFNFPAPVVQEKRVRTDTTEDQPRKKRKIEDTNTKCIDHPAVQGKKIAEARKENNLTQEDLAKLVGVKPETLVRWEEGLTSPYKKYRKELAKVLKKPFDEPKMIPGSKDLKQSDMFTIGIKVREAREELNLSIQELANLVGVHENTLNCWELGYTGMREKNLSKLAEVLGKPTSYFST